MTMAGPGAEHVVLSISIRSLDQIVALGERHLRWAVGRLGLLAVLGVLIPACGIQGACPEGCVLTSGSATISVPCPAGVIAATSIGPCTIPSAQNADSTLVPNPQTLYVLGSGQGTCHVQITFADGYVYAANIQFVDHRNSNSPGCPYCPPITDPVAQPPAAIDPGASCAVDGGLDTD